MTTAAVWEEPPDSDLTAAGQEAEDAVAGIRRDLPRPVSTSRYLSGTRVRRWSGRQPTRISLWSGHTVEAKSSPCCSAV